MERDHYESEKAQNRGYAWEEWLLNSEAQIATCELRHFWAMYFCPVSDTLQWV